MNIAAAQPIPLPPPMAISQFINDPARIDMPLENVTVQEIHPGTNGKLIIHIQDAHANLSGQQSLAKALDKLLTQYDLRLVLVEGSARDSSLDEIRKLAPLKEWSIIARRFLYEGIISGEEYLNLTTEHPMKIIGVEYRDLYDEAVKAYAAIVDRRKDILHYLYQAKVSLDRLKVRMYPRELKDYEARKGPNDGTSTIDFKTGFSDLMKLAAQAEYPLTEMPQVKKLKELMEKESRVDFDKASKEQEAILKGLSVAGANEEVRAFSEASRRLRYSQVSQYLLIQKLLQTASKREVAIENFPELMAYAGYLEKFTDLKMEALMTELEYLEDKVYEKLLPDDNARKVRAIDRFLGLLGNAYKLQMSSHDFGMFTFNEKDFKTEGWLAFMNRQLVDLGFFESLVPYKPYLEDARADFGRFYQLVGERDNAFVENAHRIMTEQHESAAVLIAGGYHTAHLTELLRAEGTSYIVLTPVVTDTTDHERYEELLLSHLKDQEKRLAASGSAAKKDTAPYRAQNVAATKIPRGIRALSAVDGARLANLPASVEKFVASRVAGLPRTMADVTAKLAEGPEATAARMSDREDIAKRIKALLGDDDQRSPDQEEHIGELGRPEASDADIDRARQFLKKSMLLKLLELLSKHHPEANNPFLNAGIDLRRATVKGSEDSNGDAFNNALIHVEDIVVEHINTMFDAPIDDPQELVKWIESQKGNKEDHDPVAADFILELNQDLGPKTILDAQNYLKKSLAYRVLGLLAKLTPAEDNQDLNKLDALQRNVFRATIGPDSIQPLLNNARAMIFDVLNKHYSIDSSAARMSAANQEVDLKSLREHAKAVAAIYEDIRSDAAFDQLVIEKNDNSPVMLADYLAQIMTEQFIFKNFPNDGFVAEEEIKIDVLKGLIAKLSNSDARSKYEMLVKEYGDDKQLTEWLSLMPERLRDAPSHIWTADPVDGTASFLAKGKAYGGEYAYALKRLEWNSEARLYDLNYGLAFAPEFETEYYSDDREDYVSISGPLFEMFRSDGTLKANLWEFGKTAPVLVVEDYKPPLSMPKNPRIITVPPDPRYSPMKLAKVTEGQFEPNQITYGRSSCIAFMEIIFGNASLAYFPLHIWDVPGLEFLISSFWESGREPFSGYTLEQVINRDYVTLVGMNTATARLAGYAAPDGAQHKLWKILGEAIGFVIYDAPSENGGIETLMGSIIGKLRQGRYPVATESGIENVQVDLRMSEVSANEILQNKIATNLMTIARFIKSLVSKSETNIPQVKVRPIYDLGDLLRNPEAHSEMLAGLGAQAKAQGETVLVIATQSDHETEGAKALLGIEGVEYVDGTDFNGALTRDDSTQYALIMSPERVKAARQLLKERAADLSGRIIQVPVGLPEIGDYQALDLLRATLAGTAIALHKAANQARGTNDADLPGVVVRELREATALTVISSILQNEDPGIYFESNADADDFVSRLQGVAVRPSSLSRILELLATGARMAATAA